MSRSTLSSALTNGKFPKDMFPENVKSTFGLGFATGMTFMDIIWFLNVFNDISGVWRGEKKIKTQPDPDQRKRLVQLPGAGLRWALPAGPRKRRKHCRCRESLECVDLVSHHFSKIKAVVLDKQHYFSCLAVGSIFPYQKNGSHPPSS